MSNEKSSAKDEIRFNVRINPELHARITTRAAANGRSMNSEIITLLEKALDDVGVAEFRFLLDEYARVRKQAEGLADLKRDTEVRRASIMRELAAIASADTAAHVPKELRQKALAVVNAIKEDYGI